MSHPPANRAPLTDRDVLATWWPLAASWLLMGMELPAVSAALARLPEPTLGLAAYGGVVFPISLLIESPVLMLLSASTALSRDAASYALGRRFMLVLGGGFTALHALVAFTPLYDFVVRHMLGAPEEIVEPARIGLRIMTPWTMAIAYRRFQQGVLIRFGHSRAIGVGTAVRLATQLLVLGSGVASGRVPGIVVATAAVAAGVVAEAIYSAFRVRPLLRTVVREAPRVDPPLTRAGFLRFYLPLMVTPLFVFLLMPLATAAMSRMARPLDSLAVWPVVNGFVFALRSGGFAFNEVVLALLDRDGALDALRRFAHRLAFALTAVIVLVAATPLSGLWFGGVASLPAHLVPLALTGLWIAAPFPALTVYQHLMQGIVVHRHRTRQVTVAVAIMLAVATLAMAALGRAGSGAGVHVALAAMVAGNLAMLAWLARAARQTS